MKNGVLPDKLYRQVIRAMPIICVDLVIKTDKGVLLGIRKRKGEPGRGLKWLIGGRLLYRERLEEAVKRKAKEETGLDVTVIRQIGVYTVFTKAQKRHNIAVNYLVESKGGVPKPNPEYSRFLFLDRIDSKLHPYVRAVLRDSGAFSNAPRRPTSDKAYLVD